MLISIAIDFRHADVATRERFHLSEERLAQLYQTVRTDVITEAALISTCNRTELYAWVASEAPEVIALRAGAGPALDAHARRG